MMVYYNICRKHASLKGQTPAMAAGLTDYLLDMSNIQPLNIRSFKSPPDS